MLVSISGDSLAMSRNRVPVITQSITRARARNLEKQGINRFFAKAKV